MSNYTTSKQVAGDVFNRGGSFTPPRTITLDTKYEGAVAISVWTGYAVQIISKTGKREVVVGPKHILLEYDETLAPLTLSTGTPKTDTATVRTVYLRVVNNRVSDVVQVDSADFVPLKLNLSYRINFEGEPSKWFEVENYVKLLTDHLRSVLRNEAKQHGIEELYRNTVNIVRNAILGPDGAGLPFKENGMRVYDVEVLGAQIVNPDIATLIWNSQKTKLTEQVGAALKEDTIALTQRTAQVEQQAAKIRAEKAEAVQHYNRKELDAAQETEVTRIKNVLAALELDKQRVDKELETAKAKEQARLDLVKAEAELFVERLKAETEQIVKRSGAVSPQLAQALITVSDASLVERITTALAPVAAMQGVSAAEVLQRLFANTPVEGVLQQLAARGTVPLLAEKK